MSAVLQEVDAAGALAAAHDALDELFAVPLSGCSDDQLLELMRGYERLRRRLPTGDHAFVLEAESRALPDRHACRTTSQFLRSLLRLAPHEAAGRVRAAEAAGSAAL